MGEIAERSALERACALVGIEPSYRDVWGIEHAVPEASLRALLADFGDGADEWQRSAPPEAQRPCYLPDEWKAGGRIWGPAVQLYALRSQRKAFGEMRYEFDFSVGRQSREHLHRDGTQLRLDGRHSVGREIAIDDEPIVGVFWSVYAARHRQVR